MNTLDVAGSHDQSKKKDNKKRQWGRKGGWTKFEKKWGLAI